MTMHYLPGPEQARRMTTDELRASFLVQGLFVRGAVTLRHIDLDRVVLGGAVPAREPLRLHAPDSLGAQFFTERRELGVLNIGGAGRVTADGKNFALATRDLLYVGRGTRDIAFASEDAGAPARFYLISYPAHADHPTTLVRRADVEGEEIGSAERANRRRIARYVHLEGARSAQLVMGVTALAPGSVWNTMPAHTHHRRTEVYLYFDLPEDAMVVHLMGEPGETRHLIVRDGEAILSPGWSVHSGCGTSNYTFCWAMGGENQVYTDMQGVDAGVMR
jgi:4-deoxy-L-threo-5-hexosulose-uronate ketol-isomerase